MRDRERNGRERKKRKGVVDATWSWQREERERKVRRCVRDTYFTHTGVFKPNNHML